MKTVKTVNKKIDSLSNPRFKGLLQNFRNIMLYLFQHPFRNPRFRNKFGMTLLLPTLCSVKAKIIICGILIFSSFVSAQTKNHSLQNINCKTCHTCDVPTKQNPCLVECPRSEMVTVHQPAEKGPDVIKIDKLADKYLPVTFSHKVHAQMSNMSGGCANCHHYNTAGPILACSDCHSAERKREDISKPDLQAAFHRQCIDCHKEWSHSTDCNSCHLQKGSTVTKKETKGKDHPKVNEPEKIIYATNYNKGKIVTFFHNEHTTLFGADCVSCHQNDNCTRCHDTKNVKTASSNIPEKISKSGTQHHQPCFKCHANDECSKCHLDKPMGPFNHKINTGWALNRFHEKLECTKCHGSGNQFTKLNNSCISCHKNFAAGSFKHETIGLKLDEIHTELDCGDCHSENNFGNKPDCSGCHDDKSYPKDKPGNIIKIVKQ
jgi:Class III cytochrome C family